MLRASILLPLLSRLVSQLSLCLQHPLTPCCLNSLQREQESSDGEEGSLSLSVSHSCGLRGRRVPISASPFLTLTLFSILLSPCSLSFPFTSHRVDTVPLLLALFPRQHSYSVNRLIDCHFDPASLPPYVSVHASCSFSPESGNTEVDGFRSHTEVTRYTDDKNKITPESASILYCYRAVELKL